MATELAEQILKKYICSNINEKEEDKYWKGWKHYYPDTYRKIIKAMKEYKNA